MASICDSAWSQVVRDLEKVGWIEFCVPRVWWKDWRIVAQKTQSMSWMMIANATDSETQISVHWNDYQDQV